MSEERLVRWIRGYDRATGRLLREVRLPENTSLDELQRVFGERLGNPMVDSYAVGSAEQRTQLTGILGTSFFEDELDYFLEADAELIT